MLIFSLPPMSPVPYFRSSIPMNAMGPETFNVDAPDGPEEEPEAFSPDYASLPAVRPAHPPQYRPTPNYGMEGKGCVCVCVSWQVGSFNMCVSSCLVKVCLTESILWLL